MDNKKTVLIIATVTTLVVVIGVSVAVHMMTSEDSDPESPLGPDAASVSTCQSSTHRPSFNNTLPGMATSDLSVYPWTVKIRVTVSSGDDTLCSGSLIDDQHVLTATHCIQTLNSSVAGFIFDTDRRLRVEIERGPAISLTVGVQAAFMHQDFYEEEGTGHPDIAVLRLDRSLSRSRGWNVSIVPVCLPGSAEKAPALCEAVGWRQSNPHDNDSATDDSASDDSAANDSEAKDSATIDSTADDSTAKASPRLERISLKMYPYPECFRFRQLNNRSSFRTTFEDSEVCTSADQAVCFGDSGGALLCRQEGESRLKQFGVVSHLHGQCVTAGKTTTFDSVPFYRPWLEYVALPVLNDTKNRLVCMIDKCLGLRKDDWWGENGVLVCRLFAVYNFCQHHDPRPQRCRKTVIPLVLWDRYNTHAFTREKMLRYFDEVKARLPNPHLCRLP